ncbi:MAG: GNAT family N-acetyltransferase, partial [Candidatus Hermodarchaeota archaeon]
MNLIIKQLTPDLLEDFLNFFDNIAFTDNPDWADCYCRFYHFPGSMKEWSRATKEQNRSAVINLINEKKMTGLLAYV